MSQTTVKEFLISRADAAGIDDETQAIVISMRRNGAISYDSHGMRLSELLGMLEFTRVLVRHRLEQSLRTPDKSIDAIEHLSNHGSVN